MYSFIFFMAFDDDLADTPGWLLVKKGKDNNNRYHVTLKSDFSPLFFVSF